MTLSVYEFGKQLLDTRDIDPVYVLLHEADLSPELRRRWLLAYFCFYHVGTASWIASDGGDPLWFWGAMRKAAGSKDYPRSSERRHFRGENAKTSVAFLQAKAQGIRSLDRLFAPLEKPQRCVDLMRYVQTWTGFGPWIAFKVADMIERLGIAQVSFDNASVFLFDSPREAAKLMWDEYKPEGDAGLPTNAWAVRSIVAGLPGLKAPPRYERPINVQEAETILCKWGSYRKGHYHVGEDVEACRVGLLRFPRCRLSQRLLAAGRSAELWE